MLYCALYLLSLNDKEIHRAKSKKKSSTLKKKPASKANVLKAKKKVIKKVVKQSKPKKVSPIPNGYHNITPCLIVNNGIKSIDFYKKVFGAKEMMRMEHDGKIGYAELKIGDSKIMLGDACPEMNMKNPEPFTTSPATMHLYTKDVDAMVKKAIAAGAKLASPVEDKFYGDRSGTIQDPFGHTWSISTRIENLTTAQIRKRAAALFSKK